MHTSRLLKQNVPVQPVFYLLAAAFFLSAVVSLTHAESTNTDGEKPNIMFIIADDYVYEALGATSRTEVQTPNLDRLTRQSTRFSRSYNMGSWTGAVCIASRTMLNTGRFLWNAKNTNGGNLQNAGKTWSQQMSQAGYDTYFAGKWHVKGISAGDVFDNVRHVRPGMPNDHSDQYNRPQSRDDHEWKPWDKSYGGYWKGGTHWSVVLKNDAQKFLKQTTERNNPFFMYLAFNAPHDPKQAPKKFVENYPYEQMRVPENFLPKYPHRKEINSPWGVRDEKLAPMPRTEYAIQVHRAQYYAIVQHMDRQIGRMLKALENTGKLDNTYIIFTADHGLSLGRHGLMGKQNVFEHALRSPFLISGPGIPEGNVIHEPIYVQDAMATAMDLAGQDVPDQVQFRSVLPLISGQRDQQYAAIRGGYRGAQRFFTKGRYKLIMFPNVPKVLLFDLKEDPLEMNNLADREQHQKRVRAMFQMYQERQDELGDSHDLESIEKLLK